MEPLLSIACITYNQEKFIRQCLDGFVMQKTNFKFEVIIHDDASTDNTFSIIHNKYQNLIDKKKIRYIKIKKSGVSRARNIGLKLSQHSWIGYLDTDNTVSSDFLDTYVQYIKEYPEVKIFYAQMINKNSQTVIGTEYKRCKLLQGNYIDMGTLIHHKDVYKELGGFCTKIKRLVDYELILRYTEKYIPKYIPQVMLNYNDSNDYSRVSNTENYDKAIKFIHSKYKIRYVFLPLSTKIILKFKKLLHLISKEEYKLQKELAYIKNSPLFDEEWYISQNSDILNSNITAYEHYIKYGWKDGLNPSSKFDGNIYLKDNQDVANANICPLVHYLTIGAKEGRHYEAVIIE